MKRQAQDQSVSHKRSRVVSVDGARFIFDKALHRQAQSTFRLINKSTRSYKKRVDSAFHQVKACHIYPHDDSTLFHIQFNDDEPTLYWMKGSDCCDHWTSHVTGLQLNENNTRLFDHVKAYAQVVLLEYLECVHRLLVEQGFNVVCWNDIFCAVTNC